MRLLFCTDSSVNCLAWHREKNRLRAQLKRRASLKRKCLIRDQVVCGGLAGVEVEAERHHSINSRQVGVPSVVRHLRHLGLDRLPPHSTFCFPVLHSRLCACREDPFAATSSSPLSSLHQQRRTFYKNDLSLSCISCIVV